MSTQRRKDLVVLVADVQQEKTLETLLQERQPSLGIRTIAFDIFRHPRQDPGVFHEAADFLGPYASSHGHALVLLDAAWEGAPGGGEHLRSELVRRLGGKGWGPERCQVIVIRPELEAWVWADSAVVAEVHCSTSPYFMPDAIMLHEILAAGSTSYTDVGGSGSTSENHFYIVRGLSNCGTPSGYEKRLGEFDFVLVPGNE
jgi:hypothetical protein